ncbi:GumC family protein [Geotalea uraniireducens]|uniref:Lipopolysaccharide biosynthesis protein n=1 Tax=Geotalea uraniireducens (strain Rf4) TaxID=351605 RepID=A5G3Q0_GEOUR|nr:Wzz/FepE/Etk N-terminal domain-containing protein [Geotalea uraniireducens]ABQ26418.1 lipopolysaccharide biosynthesis protein [Geotalea uraniireducens Rf4]
MDERVNEVQLEEQEINLLDLLRVVIKRKGMIVKLSVSVAVISIIYCLFLPNIYTATARLLPPQKDVGGGGVSALLGQMGGLAGLAGGALGGSADLYMGILKSRSVADAVIKRLDLQKGFKTNTLDDTRNALAGVVKYQAGKDGIITITAESRDPRMAASLANVMVEELGIRSVQLNLTKAGTERAFLEKRLAVVKQDLARAEDDLKAFQEKNKIFKVDSQAAASIEGIARLRAEIVAKEVQLASLKSYQTDESPEVKLLQVSIGKLRNQLGAFSGNGAGDVIPSVGNVPNLGLEYARKLRELKTQEAIFEQLKKQYEVAKISEAKDSSSIQVLDEAVVPMKKSKPKRSLIVILATVTAFFVSIFTAFVLEYFDKMSDEDRGRWQEIKGSLEFRRRT